MFAGEVYCWQFNLGFHLSSCRLVCVYMFWISSQMFMLDWPFFKLIDCDALDLFLLLKPIWY